jgi:hypothetical protein
MAHLWNSLLATSLLSSYSYFLHYPCAQPMPRMTSSHIMYVHEDNIKHIYNYFKPAIKT